MELTIIIATASLSRATREVTVLRGGLFASVTKLLGYFLEDGSGVKGFGE
jgi:hypothetical protein